MIGALGPVGSVVLGNGQMIFLQLATTAMGSFFTVHRPLSTYGTHQNELHQHGTVTDLWKLLAANHR